MTMMTSGVTVRPDGRLEFVENGRVPAWRQIAAEDGLVDGTGMTVMEAAQAAGLLGWNLRKHPLEAHVDGAVIPVKGKHVMLRDVFGGPLDGGVHALGVVGDRFEPLSNEVWLEFAAAVVNESGGRAHVDCVGSLDGGRTVFMALALADGLFDIGGDKIVENLMIGMAHDGSGPLVLNPMATRLGCTNQVRGMLGRRSRSTYRVKHLSYARGLKGLIGEAQIALGIGAKYRAEVIAEAEKLLATAVTDNQFAEIIKHSFPELAILDPGGEAVSARQQTLAENKREELFGLWRGDTIAGMGIGGTGWGAVNAVGEYVDWFQTAKGDRARREFASATGIENAKERAYSAVLAVTG